MERCTFHYIDKNVRKKDSQTGLEDMGVSKCMTRYLCLFFLEVNYSFKGKVTSLWGISWDLLENDSFPFESLSGSYMGELLKRLSLGQTSVTECSPQPCRSVYFNKSQRWGSGLHFDGSLIWA